MDYHDALRKQRGAIRWGQFFTVFHVFVANIVLKWRNNGILVQRKHLFITIKVSLFIYAAHINISVVFLLEKASF